MSRSCAGDADTGEGVRVRRRGRQETATGRPLGARPPGRQQSDQSCMLPHIQRSTRVFGLGTRFHFPVLKALLSGSVSMWASRMMTRSQLLSAARLVKDVLAGIIDDLECLQDMAWSELKSSGGLADVAPSPRSAHVATAYLDRFLLIFGGGSVAHCYNDLHIFDTDSGTWEAVATEGTPPSPRAGAHVVMGRCMPHAERVVLAEFSLQAALHNHTWLRGSAGCHSGFLKVSPCHPAQTLPELFARPAATQGTRARCWGCAGSSRAAATTAPAAPTCWRWSWAAWGAAARCAGGTSSTSSRGPRSPARALRCWRCRRSVPWSPSADTMGGTIGTCTCSSQVRRAQLRRKLQSSQATSVRTCLKT